MEVSASAPCYGRETLNSWIDTASRVRLAYLLVLSLTVVLLLPSTIEHASGSLQVSRPSPGLSSLPTGLQAAASAALGATSPAYAASSARAGFVAGNPAQRLQLRFGAGGVQISAARATVNLAVEAIGAGSSLRVVRPVAPSSRANRITYLHAGFAEWFANGPLGLEQGFSVRRAPEGATGRPLTIVMELSGAMRAAIREGGRSLTLVSAGRASLRYAGLTATDANGRLLKAWLELRGDRRLLLRVATRYARYPIEIDPLIQQGASLTGGAEVGGGDFGTSVALSADGSTALVGAPSDDFRVGAAWVFTRSGSTWSQQGNKLTGTGERGEGQFGSALALSADGNTALIGGIGDDKDTGAVWVFARSGSTWTEQGGKLIGSAPEFEGRFGQSVALSGDGATALVGCGPFYGHGGGAWVFTRKGSAWSQQGARINPSGEIGEGGFGASVALSSDGSTALIGAPSDNGRAGAAWAFMRSGEEWMQQGNKLTGSEESGGGGFGEGAFGASVALSAEGNTALVGGPADTNESGAAWVFARSGSTWTQQGPKLTAGEGVAGYYAGFGRSVALSGSGNVALIGGQGAVFERSGTTWVEQQGHLFAGEGAEPESGETVSLSADGDTALIGVPNATVGNTGSAGRVYAYTALPQPPRVWPASASSLTSASAIFNAKVNPNGYEVGTCEFEYGTSLPYEHSVPCNLPPGSGESPVAVSASVSGLGEETTYHFRVVATNSVGTSYGEDETFQTRPLVPSFTWSGGSALQSEGSFDWSLGANWLEGETPTSGETIRALTFPRLGSICEVEQPAYACYESYDDVSGLNVEALRLDDADDYVIAGDQISVGGGGLTAAPVSGSAGPAGDVMAAPLRLSASQAWTVSGRGSASEEAGLLLAGNVDGPGRALEIGLGEEPVVYLAEDDTEVGPLSIKGADPTKFGVFNGAVALLNAKLNASDGQPVYLSHVFVAGSGAVGDLTTNDAELTIGDPADAVEATSANFDPASRLEFDIVGSGETPRTDYSQLVSQGAIALAGANLGVVVRPAKAGEPCPTLARGRTYTFISTTGTLSGVFSNAPLGGPELTIRYARGCPVGSQTIRVGYHESGAVQTVTGTVEEDAVRAEEDALAQYRAEEESVEHRVAEEVFLDSRAEDEAARQRTRAVEAVTTQMGAAAMSARGQGGTVKAGGRALAARLAETRLQVDRTGRVGLRVSCPAGGPRCTGALTLRASKALAASSRAGKGGAMPWALATGDFDLRSGHTATVVLRLTRRARLLMSRMRWLHARATIVAHNVPGHWHNSVVPVTIHAWRVA